MLFQRPSGCTSDRKKAKPKPKLKLPIPRVSPKAVMVLLPAQAKRRATVSRRDPAVIVRSPKGLQQGKRGSRSSWGTM